MKIDSSFLGKFVVSTDNTKIFKVIKETEKYVMGFNLITGKLCLSMLKNTKELSQTNFLDTFRFNDDIMMEISLTVFNNEKDRANFIGNSIRTYHRKRNSYLEMIN